MEESNYEKIDKYNETVVSKISTNYKAILMDLGEDVNREGLLKTPERVAKSLSFLTHGSKLNPTEILKSAVFKEDYNQMVLVKDIEVYSMCEHHILPFFGKAHVAYIPNGEIVGLSKIPRISFDYVFTNYTEAERFGKKTIHFVHCLQ
jgi:GTP cyclohydrolase I